MDLYLRSKEGGAAEHSGPHCLRWLGEAGENSAQITLARYQAGCSAQCFGKDQRFEENQGVPASVQNNTFEGIHVPILILEWRFQNKFRFFSSTSRLLCNTHFLMYEYWVFLFIAQSYFPSIWVCSKETPSYASWRNCFHQLTAAFFPLTIASRSPGFSGSPRVKQACWTPGKC
jgi:hypothetical protein